MVLQCVCHSNIMLGAPQFGHLLLLLSARPTMTMWRKALCIHLLGGVDHRLCEINILITFRSKTTVMVRKDEVGLKEENVDI